ncbi:MAG TPA: glycosyltransferase family 39 protein [Cytophagaceae bacterium]|jgi:hypothetical protein|nr:glycosyltransferase family 39 protein [Cytophagaceae bacterium]
MIRYKNEMLIALLGALLFIPFLGNVGLFDWDEINFAESAREMLITGDYFKVQINFKTFWEKPPFFFWMQALSMKIFGVNEFAARFPNAIIGIITLVVIYRIGKKVVNEQFGFLWVLAYTGSFLPHFYFRSGIIDPTFNLFIFLSIYFWAKHTEARNHGWSANDIYLAGFFGGMATLTKGPVGVLIVGLTVLLYWIYQRQWKAVNFLDILKYAAVVFVVSFAWFGVEFVKNGPYFMQEFIIYQIRLFQTQDAGHGGPFYYHAVVLFLGCFPVSIFAIQGLLRKTEDQVLRHYLLWIKTSFWVVLILFSIVNTKIVHYSSFCYFPITFIGAWIMQEQLKRGEAYGKKWVGFMVTFLGGLLAAVFVLLPIVMAHKELWLNLSFIQEIRMNDPFTWSNLQAPVRWTGYEWIAGVALYAGLLAFGYYAKRNVYRAILALFIGTLATIELVLPLVVPRVEEISQKEAVDFYKSIAKEDKYVYVHGYKSYAHYFYADVQPTANPFAEDLNWLLNGEIDKTVYIVTKVGSDADNELKGHPNLQRIGGEYGFIFYRRLPHTKKTTDGLAESWHPERR